MAIDGIDGSGLSKRTEGFGKPGPERSRPESAGGAGGDTVELSPDARRIATLARSAGALPDVRAERIDALRQSIEQGSYKVDPRALARAILEFEDGF